MSRELSVLLHTVPALAVRALQELARSEEVNLERLQETTYRITRSLRDRRRSRRVYTFRFAYDPQEVKALLAERYFDVALVDGRSPAHSVLAGEVQHDPAALLEELGRSGRGALRFFRTDRILMLVDAGPRLPETAFQLGRHRIAGFVTEPFEAARLFDRIDQMVRRRPRSKRAALCLAGGGLEGLLFQMGALRALSTAFRGGRSICDFDQYYGISAGAFMAAFLANGIPPETVIRAFEGESAVLDPVTPRIVYDLNLGEMLRRAGPLLRSLLKPWNTLEAVSGIVKAMPSGICRGDRLERFVAEQIRRAGGVDRFCRVRRELYIGATDQDSWTHRLFGAARDDAVRISEAVRASSALVPFYAPKEIQGRDYVDGGFTVSSHFHEAAERGAKLVVTVDPLVPATGGEVGYVRRRGGIFAGIEGIKAMSHSRFEARYEAVVRSHPETTFLHLRPREEAQRVMGGSPMRYRIRMGIERLGFESTCHTLDQHRHAWEPILERFGFRLALKALEAERERLASGNRELRRVLTSRGRRPSSLSAAHRALSNLDDHLELLMEQELHRS